jgi:hypothetical protein
MQPHDLHTRNVFMVILFVLCSLFTCAAEAQSADSSPGLLPPAEEFRLTLQEAKQADLPLGPSCGGEASLTLMCRPFILRLENVGAHTVRISGLRCQEPWIRFEKKLPAGFSSEWWPISQPEQPHCETLDWTQTRLRPGEHIEYATRLASPRRGVESVESGTYTIRANWMLFGCTEIPEGTDCLSPLQDSRTVERDPVIAYSNELTVESPDLGNLGTLSFGFEVRLAPNELSKTGPGAQACTGDATSIDCTAFHFSIRNLGDRPVRNGTFSCTGWGISPEYRFEASEWRAVPISSMGCNENVFIETAILPGATIEGTFRLPTLAPGYDTSELRKPGLYNLRFRFWSHACIASPDGRFGLICPEKQPPTISNEVTVRVPNSPPGETRP